MHVVASAYPEVLAPCSIGKRRACHGDFHISPVNALAGGRKSIRFCTLIVSLQTSLTPTLSINTLYNTARLYIISFHFARSFHSPTLIAPKHSSLQLSGQ